MPRRVYVPAQRGEREDSYARPDRFSAGEVGRNPDHVQTVGKFQKGVKYIVPFFMRMTAGPCPRTPSFPDFHQEFFFARLRPNSAPARMTGLNLLCAVALPGMIYPEDTHSSRRDHQNRGPQRQIFVAGVERAATLYEIKQDPVSLGMPKRVRIFWRSTTNSSTSTNTILRA